MSKQTNLRSLTESAICVAAAVVLSLFTLFTMPLGGSVTPFATLPIIIIGLRHGSKWGVSAALVFSMTQLLLGMGNVLAVPVKTFGNLALCAMLDYVLAYTVLGFTGALYRRFQQRWLGLCIAIGLTGLCRMACSVISGIVVWGPYAPEGWDIAAYSFAYNALWCVPDTAMVLIACLALTQVRKLELLPS